MDEITLVRDLGTETSLPSPERLAAARARLVSEVAPARSRKRLPALLAAAAAAVTVAVAVPVVLSPAAPEPGPTSATEAPKLVTEAAFLNEAAGVAEQDADLVPRGDQYIYVRMTLRDGASSEHWLSIDGEHDGRLRAPSGEVLTIAGCKDGKTFADDGKTVVGCEPLRRYRPDMPTDPAAMVAWLEKYEGAGKNVDALGKFVGGFASEFWLRPAQRAALYRSIGRIDGLRLVEGVKDARGRAGVGVAWTSPGAAEGHIAWIFDPKTHRLLGTPEQAIDRIALVDGLGQKG